MKKKKDNIHILFLVKDDLRNLRSSVIGYGKLPKERYWGLKLLQAREEFCLTPWPIGEQRISFLRRVVNRFNPELKIYGHVASPELLKRLRVVHEQYDVALSFNHVITASLLVLKRQDLFRPPIVCLAIGIADWLGRATPSERKRTIESLARADRLLAMSRAEIEFLRAAGLNQTVLLPFGVDSEYWSPTGEPLEDYVFAVGSDPCRDFDTIVQSCPYPLKIMTRARHLIHVPIPPNVSFVQGDTEALRSLYARARTVVVSLKDTFQPSGQNTVLQAMAMEKPVVLTCTKGIWSDKLKDKENCLFVQPENSDDLRNKLKLVYEDRPFAQAIGVRARQIALQHFDAHCLADALSEIITQVVNR